MGLSELISSTPEPRTRETLARDLRRLGLATGAVVIVHASLRSLGWVCGAEVAVVQALLDVLGPEGTLFAPTHTSDNTDPAEWANPPVPAEWIHTVRENMPAFDPAITPGTHMGAVAECIRTWPGARRCDHPCVSFAAVGPRAHELTNAHSLNDSLGEGSPLARLYDLDASVLLMGVTHARNTAMHLGEYRSGIRPRKRVGAAVLRDGNRQWVWYEDIAYDSDDFERIGRDFELAHPKSVRIGRVGNSESRLVSARAVVDFTRQYFIANGEAAS
jgi:aminoglycoside 3-N-acetyltransferase